MIEPTEDYPRAQAAAVEHDMAICATYKDGRPIYFLAPPGAGDEQLRDLSFEAQNGRPMSDGERQLLAAAMEKYPGSFTATREDVPA